MTLIVLIGVTGSGKTTVGRLLSERYGMPLYEVDAAVEESLGAPRSVGLGAPRAVLTQLMTQAREAYAAVADTTVDTSTRTPQEVADFVARACKLTPDY